MKTLREVLGKGAANTVKWTHTELKPWILMDGDEYVPVNRGPLGLYLFVEHDMDDERHIFTNEEVDAAVWNPDKQVWVIMDTERDEPVEIQVVERDFKYVVLMP